MNFLVLLKARSHSVAIAGIDKVSEAHKQRVSVYGFVSFHHSIGETLSLQALYLRIEPIFATAVSGFGAHYSQATAQRRQKLTSEHHARTGEASPQLVMKGRRALQHQDRNGE